MGANINPEIVLNKIEPTRPLNLTVISIYNAIPEGLVLGSSASKELASSPTLTHLQRLLS